MRSVKKKKILQRLGTLNIKPNIQMLPSHSVPLQRHTSKSISLFRERTPCNVEALSCPDYCGGKDSGRALPLLLGCGQTQHGTLHAVRFFNWHLGPCPTEPSSPLFSFALQRF